MASADVLTETIDRTHEDLAARLRHLRSPGTDHPEQPRAEYIDLDTFLAAAAKHLHAVDQALLPPATKLLDDGKERVRHYLTAAKELEVELAHVKAHAYGSVYERGVDWSQIWPDVEAALRRQQQEETELAGDLAAQLDDEAVGEITDQLYDASKHAPSRPHPFLPHTGPLGAVSRAVMRKADAFWDTAEGRMSPEPVKPPKPMPGLMGRYVLGDPYFDATDPEAVEEAEADSEPDSGDGQRADTA